LILALRSMAYLRRRSISTLKKSATETRISPKRSKTLRICSSSYKMISTILRIRTVAKQKRLKGSSSESRVSYLNTK